MRTSKMKIEILNIIPNRFLEEYEFVRFGRLKSGDWFWNDSCPDDEKMSLCEDASKWAEHHRLIFRKKQSWKDKIVFPSVYREGCWAVQCNTFRYKGIKIFMNMPTFVNTEWLGAGGAMHLLADMNDLSFLPQGFWDCKPEDSLVQVRHEVKR
jgi:hypothetical protein